MPRPLRTISVAGDKQISRGMSRLAENVKDLREPFKEVVRLFWQSTEEQIDSAGGRGGSSWEALAPSTLERKRRGGFPDTIMVRTGNLRDSLSSMGNSSTVEEIGKLSLRLGTDLPYAIYQHQGHGIPARPLIALTESDKREMMRTIQRYLVKEARKDFAGLMPQAKAGQQHVRSI